MSAALGTLECRRRRGGRVGGRRSAADGVRSARVDARRADAVVLRRRAAAALSILLGGGGGHGGRGGGVGRQGRRRRQTRRHVLLVNTSVRAETGVAGERARTVGAAQQIVDVVRRGGARRRLAAP